MNEDKELKETNKKSIFNYKIILAVGLLIVFSSIAGLVYIIMGYEKTNQLYANITESNLKYIDGASWQDMLDVDFDSLTKINPDVVGWIYVEGTDISYPIMYSGDDEGYLRRDINKEYAKAGSIFLEGYNLPDFTDSHNIIYGHNMRNLSMFGTLKYYKSNDNYYDGHKYFQLITPNKKMRFEIFSYFDTDPASFVYTVPYSDSPEFEEYIGMLKTNSYIDTDDIAVKSSDKIVTLSTCSSSEMRFTVHGVMIDVEKVQ